MVRISPCVIDRRPVYLPMDNTVRTGSQEPEVLTALFEPKMRFDTWSGALREGVLRHEVRVFDVRERAAPLSRADEVEAITHGVVFNYRNTGVNATITKTSSAFYKVPAAISKAKLSQLDKSFSAERAGKALDLSLPRMVNDLSRSSSGKVNLLEDSEQHSYSVIEELRAYVSQRANCDDYGYRLHQLARICLHAYTSRAFGDEHGAAPGMLHQAQTSAMAVVMPRLSSANLQDNIFLYVGDEQAMSYRAFLLMGVKEMSRFVSTQGTVYSRLVGEPESEQRIVFVQSTGALQNRTPQVADYLSVLNNPDRCLAYYYAYAYSLGLQEQATTILRQTAIMPFMFETHAVLPYRARSAPKADAYTYLLEDTSSRTGVQLTDLFPVVSSAWMLAARLQVGCGAVIFSYRVRDQLSQVSILGALNAQLGDEAGARGALQFVLRAMSGITGDLEWVNPFAEDVARATGRITGLFRNMGWLLSTYRSVVQNEFHDILKDGVDMQGATFGLKTAAVPYEQSLVVNSILGKPWSYLSERLGQQLSDADVEKARRIGAWKAVVHWRDYGDATDLPELKGRTPSPGKPRSPPREHMQPEPLAEPTRQDQPLSFDVPAPTLGQPEVVQTEPTRTASITTLGGYRAFKPASSIADSAETVIAPTRQNAVPTQPAVYAGPAVVQGLEKWAGRHAPEVRSESRAAPSAPESVLESEFDPYSDAQERANRWFNPLQRGIPPVLSPGFAQGPDVLPAFPVFTHERARSAGNARPAGSPMSLTRHRRVPTIGSPAAGPPRLPISVLATPPRLTEVTSPPQRHQGMVYTTQPVAVVATMEDRVAQEHDDITEPEPATDVPEADLSKPAGTTIKRNELQLGLLTPRFRSASVATAITQHQVGADETAGEPDDHGTSMTWEDKLNSVSDALLGRDDALARDRLRKIGMRGCTMGSDMLWS
jgi:hypothetical protein